MNLFEVCSKMPALWVPGITHVATEQLLALHIVMNRLPMTLQKCFRLGQKCTIGPCAWDSVLPVRLDVGGEGLGGLVSLVAEGTFVELTGDVAIADMLNKSSWTCMDDGGKQKMREHYGIMYVVIYKYCVYE